MAAERPVDELILSFRQKSFSVKLELHTKILSGAKNYPDFQEFFVSQNKAKNGNFSTPFGVPFRRKASHKMTCIGHFELMESQ